MKRPSRVIRNEIVKTLMKAKGPLRWQQLLRQINAQRKGENRMLGRATLASHLKALVNEGIVKREVDQSVYPPAVYYSLVKSVDETIPSKVIECWNNGKLAPFENPWNNYFFIFTDPPLQPDKIPTISIVNRWLAEEFANLDHVIRCAYRDQMKKFLPDKVLKEVEYYKANIEYVWWFEDRLRKHGGVKAVDEAREIEKKMYSLALKQLFPVKYLVIKNKNNVEFKSDEELVKIEAEEWAKMIIKNELGVSDDDFFKDELRREIFEKRKREFVEKLKGFSYTHLLEDSFQTFRESHEYVDLKFKPKDIKNPYFVIWLANKRNPTSFKNFPLLPQEQEEYEYLRERIEKAKESFEKYAQYYQKPISVLITAQIPW